MPKVSIIMPVYNGQEHLKQAINSVLVQSFHDWELIIIDDGCTDGSAKIIEWYLKQDSRLRKIENEKNLGLVASLNEGVAAAQGELLARLDSDDYWLDPDKLSKQVNFLAQNPSCALLGTGAEIINESGKKIRQFLPPTADKKIRSQILWHNCFLHSSIIVRKNVLLAAGGYRQEEKHVEDYGLWLRIGKLSQFANLPQVSVAYRLTDAGITTTNNREQISGVINLIANFKKNYPNYWLGFLKWHLQGFLK